MVTSVLLDDDRKRRSCESGSMDSDRALLLDVPESKSSNVWCGRGGHVDNMEVRDDSR